MVSPTGPALPPPAWRAGLRRRLLAWYRGAARDLPWRRDPEPYRVWISEIMLQQTQVGAVLPYFERFLIRFPTLRDLAAAPEDDVLAAWQGLGYYRRARQLKAAAEAIAERHGGAFPDRVEDARSHRCPSRHHRQPQPRRQGLPNCRFPNMRFPNPGLPEVEPFEWAKVLRQPAPYRSTMLVGRIE